MPQSSHFARVLVAADYKMKRLGMALDPTPVKGMPSYLALFKSSSKGMANMMPRWWMEPNYDSVTVSPDGMAYQLKGQGVKCLTEETFIAANDPKQNAVKPSPFAKKWADNMTAHYDELCAKESIFGQLRGCMDLAVTAALIRKEHLAEKASCSMPVLLNEAELPIDQYYVPKQVNSIASMMHKGSNWIFTVSGGVQVDSWNAVQKTQTSEALTAVRAAAVPAIKSWWWN